MRKIRGILIRSWNISRRRPHDYFHVFVWPFLFLLPLGFLLQYAQVGPEKMYFIVSGIIMWRFMYLSQMDISYGMLYSLWSRSFRNVAMAPLRDSEFVLGYWIYSILRATVIFILMNIVAYFLFGFNILLAGPWLIPILIGFMLFGIPLGLVTLSTVYLLGQKAEVTAWSITDIVMILSGVFYPIIIFPETIQAAASALPPTHGLNALRELLLHGTVNHAEIAMLYLLGIAAIFLMALVYRYAKNRALRTGFMQKYM